MSIKKRMEHLTVAEAYLELLSARGIRYFFGNSGTDFAPIIEAFAKRRVQGKKHPLPVTVPHEITAVSMAHGYTMVTGFPQAVMVHVIVGTANALGGIINAARAQIPMLFCAGRTPITEKGHSQARDLGIHWAQESFDQAAMLREFVKWDYELRCGDQLETVVDRALALTRSEPCAPVYLTLPREVLAAEMEQFEFSDDTRLNPVAEAAANAHEIRRAAELLVAAKTPLIIVQSLGRDPQSVSVLVEFAETLAIPVVEHWHTHLCFPQQHPLHAGYDPAPYLKEADVIVVIESDAPWFPKLTAPPFETKVIQIASDPLFSAYPIRGFPSDVSLAGSSGFVLTALLEAVLSKGRDHIALENRYRHWRLRNEQLRDSWKRKAQAGRRESPVDMIWASRCVGHIIDDRSIVINEYVLDPGQSRFNTPGSYFRHSPSAALGWALGAALGVKLARPDHRVICTVGDGAYIFGVPVSAHFVSRAYDLPVLFIVFNNSRWNASKQAALSYMPAGYAAKAESIPLCELTPAVDYEMVCRAAGGYGQRVEGPEELPAALERAVHVVDKEKRQALVNVICK
ncbi:MAG: thiamine pyrophosphate-requiring protein [Deltaproteobacteria bacterium]|nr:thiamine pyrophosphate-requiring protein [Deltaproteobacteria bacterium]